MFVVLVLAVAVGSFGAFLELFLPQQVAALAKREVSEMQSARNGATDVNTSLKTLWTDLSRGAIGLSNDQLSSDQALAKQVVTNASTALTHVQAAQAYMAQADGMPFQFHSPSFVITDRPALGHLQTSLNTAIRLANAASLQVAIAQAMNQNTQGLASLNGSLAANDWAAGAKIAATVAASVKLQQNSSQNPDALLDPLWGKWMDAMSSVVIDAQQYCLAAYQGQGPLAQQDASILARARSQMSAALAAAQADVTAWQAKTIQPLLDATSREASAGGS